MSYGQTNRPEEAIPLMPQRDTETGQKSGHSLWKKRRVLDKLITTDGYQESKIFDMRFYKNIVIHIIEIGKTNAVKYNVYACLDPTHWKKLTTTDQVVSADDQAFETLNDAWAYVKIQVASNVAGLAGKVTAYIGGKTR